MHICIFYAYCVRFPAHTRRPPTGPKFPPRARGGVTPKSIRSGKKAFDGVQIVTRENFSEKAKKTPQGGQKQYGRV